MDLIDRIDEATKKLSFVQYFFAKKNFKKLEKQFRRYHEDLANEYGQDLLDQESEYFEGEEVSGDEAYDTFAHTMGYQAEYDAANQTIQDNKSKYDYKRGDENDSEYMEDFIDYLGYSTSFGSFRTRTKKEDWWKRAEKEV